MGHAAGAARGFGAALAIFGGLGDAGAGNADAFLAKLKRTAPAAEQQESKQNEIDFGAEGRLLELRRKQEQLQTSRDVDSAPLEERIDSLRKQLHDKSCDVKQGRSCHSLGIEKTELEIVHVGR